jgi:hypothetical protein
MVSKLGREFASDGALLHRQGHFCCGKERYQHRGFGLAEELFSGNDVTSGVELYRPRRRLVRRKLLMTVDMFIRRLQVHGQDGVPYL